MTTSKNRSTGRVRRALVVTAIAIGTTVGVAGTAHAAAPISYPYLGISQGPCPATHKQVYMSASAQMSKADAQRFIDRPGSEAQIRLKGDDWFDNTQLGPVDPETYTITDFGLKFDWSACVANSVLDEDPAYGDRDELYAEFRLHDIRDGKNTTAKSPNVYGNF